MGSLSARAFADEVEAGTVELDVALSWHLGSNHYPPVPAAFIATCRAAIEAGQDEDWDTDIPLPKGCNTHHLLIAFNRDCPVSGSGIGGPACDIVQAVTWKDDREVATAAALIESFHLDSFL